jgi:hypothetical protein
MKHLKTQRPKTRVQLTWISLKLAAQWLKMNTDNRKIYPKLVKRYATDIMNDNWELSIDLIIFDENGMLLNGQHRLHAVMMAQKGIWAYVGYGFNKRSQFTCDQGKKRSAGDAIKILDGVTVGHLGLAVSAQLYGASAHRELTLDQRREFYFKHRRAIEFACRAVHHKCRAAAAAMIARAWYRVGDKDKLLDFGEATVYDNHGVKKAGAVNKLRKWLYNLEGASGSTIDHEIGGKTRTALKAFLAGRSLQKLYATEDQLHLLPGEKR